MYNSCQPNKLNQNSDEHTKKDKDNLVISFPMVDDKDRRLEEENVPLRMSDFTSRAHEYSKQNLRAHMVKNDQN